MHQCESPTTKKLFSYISTIFFLFLAQWFSTKGGLILCSEDIWQRLETFLSPLRGGHYWHRGGGGQGCCLTHPWAVVPKTAQCDKELSSQNVNRAMVKKLFYNIQETTLVQ